MNTIKLGKWENKTIRGRYEKSDTYWREKRKYRTVDLKDKYIIEEGIITDHAEREKGEEEYKRHQKLLIGYHYITVIDTTNPKDDIFWIQNMGSTWGFFCKEPTTDKTRYFKTFENALKLFNEYLEKEFNCTLEVVLE